VGCGRRGSERDMDDGWMDGCPIGWRDVSVGEKDTGLGY